DVLVWADRAGEYIVIDTASRNTNEAWLVPSRQPSEPAQLVAARRPGIEYSVAHLPGTEGGSLLIVTNDEAQEFRLARAPVLASDPSNWTTVVAEQPDERLHEVDVFNGYIVLSMVRDGRQLLRLVPWSALESAAPLDQSIVIDSGTPGGLLVLSHNEEFAADHVLVEVESYVEPLAWHRVDLSSGERSIAKQRDTPSYDADNYVLEERWTEATDGERIPIRLVRSKDTPLDGTAPLLHYGYGAYESSFWPGFEAWLPSLLDRGVVFVHAGVRGGGEMGRRWWLDGSMHKKMNTFTDFIDVADRLASDGIIDADRIVSRGLSAGGLLQGTVFSLRPDRWRAVVAEVPFVDVVTTMFDLDVPLTAGELDEWGDPRRREDFDYLRTYSPYDIVPIGDRPDLLVTGAIHDPRVMVHEPAKWVAKLRATDDGGSRNTLFRVETNAGGHTGPAGRFSHLSYEAEVAAFVLNAMDLA
ncbi:MAG: prolyl oligopeptidase family serine peptidase, partial [Candidatus Nanopelagicales bacterium]